MVILHFNDTFYIGANTFLSIFQAGRHMLGHRDVPCIGTHSPSGRWIKIQAIIVGRGAPRHRQGGKVFKF